MTDTRTSTRRSAVLAAVVAAVGTYKGIESMTSPALPILQRELDASRAEIAWVLTGVLLTGPIVTPIAGRLGDIMDKRRILLGVLAIVGLGTVVAAMSVSVPMLVAGQMLQGFGLCTVPLAVGILRETQPPEQAARGNGIMVAAIFAATALAMLVAGPIADHLHYGWLFWMPFIVLIAVTIAVWRVVPSCPPTARGARLDFGGAALFGLALAAVLMALTKAPEWGWTSATTLGSFALVLALGAVFVGVELIKEDPLVDIRLLVSRQVLAAVALMMVAGYAINTLFVAIPMQMQLPASTGYGLGASATLTSLVLVPGVLAGVVAPVASSIALRIGSTPTSVLCASLVLGSMLLIVLGGGTFIGMLSGMILCGFATGITITHAMNLVALGVPSDRVGSFSGMGFVIKAIGATSGAQIAASVLSTSASSADAIPSQGSFVTAYGVAGALCVAVIAVVMLAHPRVSMRGDVPDHVSAPAHV